jgi:hypothetical protein
LARQGRRRVLQDAGTVDDRAVGRAHVEVRDAVVFEPDDPVPFGHERIVEGNVVELIAANPDGRFAESQRLGHSRDDIFDEHLEDHVGWPERDGEKHGMIAQITEQSHIRAETTLCRRFLSSLFFFGLLSTSGRSGIDFVHRLNANRRGTLGAS